MNEMIAKATLPQAADLLLRWFTMELNDKTLRVDTMRFLRSVGKLPATIEVGKSQSETEAK